MLFIFAFFFFFLLPWCIIYSQRVMSGVGVGVGCEGEVCSVTAAFLRTWILHRHTAEWKEKKKMEIILYGEDNVKASYLIFYCFKKVQILALTLCLHKLIIHKK